MKTSIRKMGNSQGILIPKPFLAQAGFDIGEVDIEVENDAIVIRRPVKKPRHGWAEASKSICAANDELPGWLNFASMTDQEIVW
jgi:antitoxin MazE